MHPVDLVVCLLIVLVVLVIVAQRLKVSPPIVLVIGGLVLALYPRLPEVKLEPDIVFLVFLPPLLYWDAINSSWRDFRENWRPISLLAIGLVFTTTMAVMVVAHSLLGFLWGPAFVLGAVLGPTDTVAAVAILERFNLPRQWLAVLRGESLLNDALALVLYESAVRVAQTRTYVWGSISLGFCPLHSRWNHGWSGYWLVNVSTSAPLIESISGKYSRLADRICSLFAGRRAPRFRRPRGCHCGSLPQLERPEHHVRQNAAAIDRSLGSDYLFVERSAVHSHRVTAAHDSGIALRRIVAFHHPWLRADQWNGDSGSNLVGVYFDVCSPRIQSSLTPP